MAIARNKKKEPDAAAIAAFGAAAETRFEGAERSATTAPGTQRGSRELRAADTPPPAEVGGPKASLVRWANEEELRDDLIAYGKSNRYNMQELMIETMRRGLADMKASGS